MVCLGNICRSPIAEGILRAKTQDLGLNWQIDSAGTNGLHIGEAPHHFSQKVCAQHGIDISAQRARKLTKQDLSNYDIIYALATDVYEAIENIAGTNEDLDKVKLFLTELDPYSTKSVPDPWYGDESAYLPVFQIIDATCSAIIKNEMNRSQA